MPCYWKEANGVTTFQKIPAWATVRYYRSNAYFNIHKQFLLRNYTGENYIYTTSSYIVLNIFASPTKQQKFIFVTLWKINYNKTTTYITKCLERSTGKKFHHRQNFKRDSLQSRSNQLISKQTSTQRKKRLNFTNAYNTYIILSL